MPTSRGQVAGRRHCFAVERRHCFVVERRHCLLFSSEGDQHLAIQEIKVPNIGDATNVEVIEVLVSPGDHVKKDDSLITLESEKASMEIPSPAEGVIDQIKVKIGDRVSEGSLILTLKGQEAKTAAAAEAKKPEVAAESKPIEPSAKEAVKESAPSVAMPASSETVQVHAGPAVRRIAREFGIDLGKVKGSGTKDRILKEDLQKYVKTTLHQGSAGQNGLQVPKGPEIDFSKFGDIETVALNKIKKLTGVNVHRSWVTVPHVTQFGEADITDLEEFREDQKAQLEKTGIKLTPLVFIMKAVVAALKKFPNFNSSLDSKGENLILKKYYNLGIAVDTPNGLVVPVVRDVDQKNMVELAVELSQLSKKAREKGLTPAEMSGGCFTISSLGGIGGTAFTPIVNAPEVAILGVSKAQVKPIYEDQEFVPRLMLPLSLSYDHRVVDGADGARFLVFLANCLTDIRTLLL